MGMIEFHEPYPIYRGFRVPVWEDGGPKTVRRLVDEDKKAFEEALRRLKYLIELVTKPIQEEDEKIERIADVMTIFFKAPLIQEISPFAPTPLKAYALSILLPSRFKGKLGDLYRFADTLVDLKPELDQIKVLFEPETGDIVLRVWLAFPADTRPGYNTSSLVSHLLLTSAIAWALEHNSERLRRNTIRLAALFHDLGKAVDPERHYEASENLVKLLLGNVLSNQSIERIANAVREHHVVESSLSRADRLASAADRLDRLVKKTIGNKLEKMRETLSGCKDEWELWRRAYKEIDKLRNANIVKDDPIKELTKEFLDQTAHGVEELEEREIEGISLVIIDVASIQEFVYRSQEIRAVAAASHLIDLLVHAHFLNYLHANEIDLPPETVIYSGGGNILMILPDDIAKKVEELAEKYSGQHGISLSVAKTRLSDSYMLTSRRLSEEMARRKLRLKLDDKLEAHSGHELCGMCYSDWATESLPSGKRVCELCKKHYDLGSRIHFGPKWNSEVVILGDKFSSASVFGRRWDEISERIIEIIAGHEPEELERLGGEIRYRDYAVIKFDGNMMGSFMMEAISFTDAVERSFRVDIALKKAYFKALKILYDGIKNSFGESEARKEASRLFLGTIYMGGDDGVILTPAWAAVPLAHFIAEEFARQLGLSRGLTVAVAAGPAKMNIWSLLDCASRMMELAKDIVRNRGLSALVFDLFESGSPSGASAEERLKEFSVKFGRKWDEKVDSSQPYLITRSDLEGNTIPEMWNTIFPLILDLSHGGKWSDIKSAEMHKIALEKAFMISRPKSNRWDVNKVQDPQKMIEEIRNAILRSLDAVAGSIYWREKLYIYIHRQLQRESLSEPVRTAYGGLIQLMERVIFDEKGNLLRDRGAVPLVDILTLLKLMRGGAW